MSKKVDKSRSSKNMTEQQRLKKHFNQEMSKSKNAAKQYKQNEQVIKKLKKQDKKLLVCANRSKYFGKYVIVNHFDADGSWAYYINPEDENDILMECDENPSVDALVNGDGVNNTCLFTNNEVKSFINEACRKLFHFKDMTPELNEWAKRRLYGSVIPAYLAVNKAKQDEQNGL